MTVNNFHVYIVRIPGADGGFPPLDGSLGKPQNAEVDPYIASLIARLQREVRDERRLPPAERWRTKPRWTYPAAEVPPPLSETPQDFDDADRDERWPLPGDSDLEDFDL